MTEAEPSVVAAIDQDRAELAHIIEIVHEHQKECTSKAPCPGHPLVAHLLHMPAHKARRLLLVAVSVLGRGESLWHEH